jgi:hypothetical protein
MRLVNISSLRTAVVAAMAESTPLQDLIADTCANWTPEERESFGSALRNMFKIEDAEGAKRWMLELVKEEGSPKAAAIAVHDLGVDTVPKAKLYTFFKVFVGPVAPEQPSFTSSTTFD